MPQNICFYGKAVKMPAAREITGVLQSRGESFGSFMKTVLGSAQVKLRRTTRLVSIKVQLRINHMDVCCGPPTIRI